MFPIVNKQILAKDIKRIDVKAPSIAAHIQPGQFVMVIPEENCDWIPLTVLEADVRRETIALIFQETGSTTRQLGAIPIKDSVFSIIGPLGKPVTIKKEGIVICVATGIGTASILPVCRGLKTAGNKVIGVMGAKTKRSLMLEAQMRIACHKLFIATEDGSYERRGLATSIVKEQLGQAKVNLVYAIGSAEMMQAVSDMTRERAIKTLVRLSPVMHCGTGICGSCRTQVNRKTLLTCIDGPEFDGHQINFENLKVRMNAMEVLSEDNNPDSPEKEHNEVGLLKKILFQDN